jgi:formylmethanofuran dehydrogenase subunit C
VLGPLGAVPGAGMRRGTIVAMSQVALLPTFAFACSYRPLFVRLYLRHLRGLGLPLADEQIEGRYARWSGDGLELRRGEILIFDAGG